MVLATIEKAIADLADYLDTFTYEALEQSKEAMANFKRESACVRMGSCAERLWGEIEDGEYYFTVKQAKITLGHTMGWNDQPRTIQ